MRAQSINAYKCNYRQNITFGASFIERSCLNKIPAEVLRKFSLRKTLEQEIGPKASSDILKSCGCPSRADVILTFGEKYSLEQRFPISKVADAFKRDAFKRHIKNIVIGADIETKPNKYNETALKNRIREYKVAQVHQYGKLILERAKEGLSSALEAYANNQIFI